MDLDILRPARDQVNLTALTICAAYLLALLVSAGCAPTCGRELGHHAKVAQFHPDAVVRERSTNALRRAVHVCDIPSDGIRMPGTAEPPTHAAQIYLMLGELDAAIAAVESDEYTMSDMQQYVLLGYAVRHENDDYLEALLNAGLDPNAELGDTRVTVIFDAIHAGPDAPARVQLLIDFGADPFAISDGGFSILDSAVLNENDAASEFVLQLIADSEPKRLDLVENAISVAETVDPDRALILQTWLDQQSERQ